MSAAAAVAAGQLILGIIGASESAKAGRKAERLMINLITIPDSNLGINGGEVSYPGAVVVGQVKS